VWLRSSGKKEAPPKLGCPDDAYREIEVKRDDTLTRCGAAAISFVKFGQHHTEL
jgi:hypothetical protein